MTRPASPSTMKVRPARKSFEISDTLVLPSSCSCGRVLASLPPPCRLALCRLGALHGNGLPPLAGRPRALALLERLHVGMVAEFAEAEHRPGAEPHMLEELDLFEPHIADIDVGPEQPHLPE